MKASEWLRQGGLGSRRPTSSGTSDPHSVQPCVPCITSHQTTTQPRPVCLLASIVCSFFNTGTRPSSMHVCMSIKMCP